MEGDHRSEKSLAAFKRQGLGKVSGDLVTLWETMETTHRPIEKSRERESIHDHESGFEWSIVQKSFKTVLAVFFSRYV